MYHTVLFLFLLSLSNIGNFPVAIAASPNSLTQIIKTGFQKSDPHVIEQVDGNLSILKYKLFNVKSSGYTKCKVENVKGNLNTLTLHYEVDCPKIDLAGQYNISGRLIVLPIQGDGDFDLTTGRYYITTDSDLKKVQGDDGKSYLSIKNFKLKIEARAPIRFHFQNLFNGNKELSDAVHKFSQDNWKEVTEVVQDPVFYASTKKIVSQINKELKTIPMDEVLLN